jgi:DNA-binding transcriptional regulator YiaG
MDYVQDVQQRLGLSDTKIAASLCVTRQTWANWRKGRCCPPFAIVALRCMMELRRLQPDNDNLPSNMRVKL